MQLLPNAQAHRHFTFDFDLARGRGGNTYLHNANDNVLESRPLRVVVEYERTIALFGTAKGGRPHTWIQRTQMIV